jgi:hypothetical protein
MTTITSKNGDFTVTVTNATTDTENPVITLQVDDAHPNLNAQRNPSHTTFTLSTHALAVTHTFKMGAREPITYTLFSTEPGNRTEGTDQLLDGPLHSPRKARKWLNDHEAVAQFVCDFVEANQGALNALIGSSRNWGREDVKRLNDAPLKVTGIINIAAPIREDLFDKFVRSILAHSN